MQPGQEILQKWDEQAARLHPRMEFTWDGLVLGAGTVLAKAGRDKNGASRVALDDEPRVMALIATAFERPVEPYLLAKISRACELWNEGEKALAHIHLAHAGLPPCGENEALRLFIAEALLADDVPPDALLEAQGFDPATLDLFKYPGQPRVPAGSGRESGEYTYGRANVTPVAFHGRERRPGHRGGSVFDAIRSFLDWLRERQKRKENEPAPETKPPTHEHSVQPQIKPFGTVESDLPRPGYGEEVPIPGLPDDIKGTDVTKPSARMPNYSSNLTRDEFESLLTQQGWTKELSPDGKAMIYSKDGAEYVVRDDAKSTEGPTADFYHPSGTGKKIDMKLRLRNE